MVGVVRHSGIFGMGDQLRGQAPVAQRPLEIHAIREAPNITGRFAARHPMRREIHLGGTHRWVERVIVRIARRAVRPPHKTGSLFECGIGTADELRLADSDPGQRVSHRRPRAFTHADGRLRRGLDQGDRNTITATVCVTRRDSGRRDPSSTTAPYDHDSAYRASVEARFVRYPHHSPLTYGSRSDLFACPWLRSAAVAVIFII